MFPHWATSYYEIPPYKFKAHKCIHCKLIDINASMHQNFFEYTHALLHKQVEILLKKKMYILISNNIKVVVNFNLILFCLNINLKQVQK